MNPEFGFQAFASDIWNTIVTQITLLGPRIVLGIIVLVIGMLLAKLIEAVLDFVFRRMKLDTLFEKIGLQRLARRAGITGSLSHGAARLVFFFLVLFTIQTFLDLIGLVVIGNGIRTVFGFLPNLLAGLAVLVLGNFVGHYVGRLAEESAKEAGVEYSKNLGRLVSLLILFIAAVIAVAQLGIDLSLVNRVLLLALAILGGSVALAFALGTREVAGNLLSGFYIRKLYRPGQHIEVSGHRGVLTGITPTKILIDTPQGTVSVPNHEVLANPVLEFEAD